MVRINLIEPEKLSDQHLIAEYDEILMLVGYVKKYPAIKNIPEEYCLGKGHITFFKNKLKYIKRRHEDLKKEMRKRGFRTNKTVNLSIFNKEHLHDWSPREKDKAIIKKRIREKLELKPDYYRYYGKKRNLEFFLKLIK